MRLRHRHARHDDGRWAEDAIEAQSWPASAEYGYLGEIVRISLGRLLPSATRAEKVKQTIFTANRA